MLFKWTNIDLYKNEYVDFYDIRNQFPYPDNTFDAIYSSHVLEHLTVKEANALLKEVYRVLKKGGIFRIVVPDLENICVEYLKYLNLCIENPNSKNIQRYNWIKLELLDQLVREQGGGLMLDTLKNKDFDKEYLIERTGEEFISFIEEPKVEEPNKNNSFDKKDSNIKKILRIPKKVFNKIKNLFQTKKNENNISDPRKTGEIHKWMYDRFSLKKILEDNNFKNVSTKKYNQSQILYWDKYNLDKSLKFDKPRKPDSLYCECVK